METKNSTSPMTSPAAKAPTGPAAASPSTKAPTGPMTTAPSKTSTAPVTLPAMEGPKAPTAPMPTMPIVQQPLPAPVPAMEVHEIKKFCKSHMHRYVLVHTKDGWCVDGFVEHIDEEVVCIAVPHTSTGLDPRAFLPYPPGYPYPPLYPYPYYPRRRFFRQIFPLTALLGLSLLPFY